MWLTLAQGTPPAVNGTEDLLGWLLWAVVAVVLALTGAVVFLFRVHAESAKANSSILATSMAAMKADLDKCEEKHSSANHQLIELHAKVGELSGQIATHKSIEETCESLATRIVDIVDSKHHRGTV